MLVEGSSQRLAPHLINLGSGLCGPPGLYSLDSFFFFFSLRWKKEIVGFSCDVEPLALPFGLIPFGGFLSIGSRQGPPHSVSSVALDLPFRGDRGPGDRGV